MTTVVNQEIVKKFKKNTTAQLLAKVTKAKGEELEVMVEILKSRGQDVSKWEGNSNTVFSAEPEEELTTEEQAQIDAAEAKLEGKPEKKIKEVKVKAPRVKKEKIIKEKVDRVPQTEPKEGSKSALILADLREGTLKKGEIVKKHETYWSVVIGVEKRYMAAKAEVIPEVIQEEAEEILESEN